MFTKAIIVFTAVMATGVLAAPQVGGASASDTSLSVGEAALQCGNNQALSCCNQGSESDGFLGGLLGGLFGACSQISVGAAGGSVPIGDACGNNIAACCEGDQDGLINLQCTPISLLKK